jgi:hypothetical protein
VFAGWTSVLVTPSGGVRVVLHVLIVMMVPLVLVVVAMRRGNERKFAQVDVGGTVTDVSLATGCDRVDVVEQTLSQE